MKDKLKKVLHYSIIWGLTPILIFSSEAQSQTHESGIFIAYETLEMAMNRFQYFAGELGYYLNPKYRVRLTIMEVNLTERHLSSKWEAAAVDGRDVEGYFRGYEVHLDRFFTKSWYVSGSLGYYEDTYEHTQMDESLENQTMTVGSGIGYTKVDLFGVKHLFLDFAIPVRYYFSGIEETKLGDATIRPHIIVNNMWLFIGYKF